MISFRKAHGLQVVARKEGALIGRFDDFQFDLESRAIYGYRMKRWGQLLPPNGNSTSEKERSTEA